MLALALSMLAWDENDVARIVSAYKPLRKHPALFDAKAGWSRWIEPRLLDALAELKAGNESAVRSLLRVEVEGSDASVYSFAIFTTDFCDRFIEELDNYYATGLPQPRPNSMNNYVRSHLRACWALTLSLSLTLTLSRILTLTLTRGSSSTRSACRRALLYLLLYNMRTMASRRALYLPIAMLTMEQAVITRMQREVLLPLSELLFPVQARGGFTGHHHPKPEPEPEP